MDGREFDIENVDTALKTGSGDLDAIFQLCCEYANRDNRYAMSRLARMYREGKGIEPNLDLAIFWMKKAYELKVSFARYELCDLYIRRSKIDANIAFELCVAEAEGKSARALGRLATMYRDGIGCEKNIDIAIKTMTSAHDAGLEWAGLELVRMLEYRNGPGDYQTAFTLCSKLSENNNIKATGHLGQMYLNGIGCRSDKDKALMYLKSAAEAGIEWARKDYKKIIRM